MPLFVKNKKAFLIPLFFLYFGVNLFPQSLPKADKTLEDFAIIESQNRFIDNLGLGTGEQAGTAYNLPVGIKKIVGNIPFTLAITNVRFGNQYGELTLIMKMRIPQSGSKQDKELLFGATDIKITNTGDLVGDVKLSLLKNIPLSLDNLGNVVFKGSLNDSTGRAESNTYVSLDCNGNFKELSIDADVILNQNTFRLVSDRSKPVTSSFKTVIHDWNDLIAEISLPAFEIKGAEGFEFSLTKATLDLSDIKNPQVFNPDPAYFRDYFTIPDPDLWRGLYIEKFTLTLPEQFKNKQSGKRIILEASHMLIDENGITGNITGKNILSLEAGDASGWGFSVNDFKLALLANNIKGFGFSGQIGIPISEKSQPRPYEAYISNNEYLFKVGLGENLSFDIFGQAQMRLDPTSYLLMQVKDRHFSPKLVLNGSMGIDKDGLKMEQVVFKKLAFATESPYFSVGSVEYGGEVKLNNFPVTISDIRFKTANDLATLGFDIKVNLMHEKIAAGGRLELASQYTSGRWKFKGLNIGAIKLANTQLAGFSLDGEIRIEKDHPVYGNYFGGYIDATFGALSSGLKVGVTSVFGNKDFRYWYVEGQAEFKGTGIPVGPVFLDGFTGGAYYRMSPAGGSKLQAYAPDDKVSLGLKAGVSYYVGSKQALNGDALFEMNFLSSGGVKNIRFYGSAQFMSPLDMSGKLGKLGDMYKKAQAKVENISNSLADKLPGNMSGSDITKKILPDLKLSGTISAYMAMDYDFPSKTFDADFKVMVSAPGGILRGAGNNNEAGWAKLHCSPQSWYIHVGTPNNPVGLKLGLGPLSLSTQSYFMLGDKLENPTVPKEVIDILGITPQEADYMKSPDLTAAGKGVAFGSRFSFDTGDMTFLILYARFMAGAGFDIMLRDMSNYACEGSNTPVGIDGWYANGQCYAYLSGELGVKIKLLFIKKKITVIKGSTAALLQARLPNPTWIGGQLAVRLNVLGGLIKANMKMKMSFGNDCKLVAINGDSSPLDMPLIADLTPYDKDTDVDVFLSPQATFNMPLGEPFDIEDDNGNIKSYRIKLADFYITDSKNQKVDGKVKMNKTNDAATFESKEILPPYNEMKVSVSVNFEEYKGGSWSVVSQNGNIARESKEASFKTGGAPNYIPLTNIAYCYPVVGQRNFFKQETNAGYVQLKKGQSYLFPDNFTYDANFSEKNGNMAKATFIYSSSDSRINYSLPDVVNQTDYELVFAASTEGQVQQAETKKTVNTQITDGEGESFSVDYMQQAAQKITKDGLLEVLKYPFRTSRYNTFGQKLSVLQLEPTSRYVSTDVRSLLLKSHDSYEIFDEAELTGNGYTAGSPLVSAEAMMDNDYYTKDIAPLVYNWYPQKGIAITGRDVNEYGVPPSKAFPLYDGYLGYISGDAFNDFMSKILPFVYELPYYYSKDYYELRTKAVNSFDKGINMQPLMPLINSHFLFIRQGDYKTTFRYNLPGGKVGTTKQMDYINTLDWR
ncbi:hypothetical protein FACS1894179_02780 [Bacteroidia bacterium]|nr:hypothetical protein FACS1894169_13920 [Bacteroidia bacterium]GHV38814.1 hypothetical protein FACS1894179_02780 [Bacteroidia bacterium]